MLRSYIRLMPSDIALRAVKGEYNITFANGKNITMPQGIISLCATAQNITKTLPLCSFYAIIHQGGDDMKKKIIIGVFSLLILITTIVSIIGAISSYNYDMDPANGVDIFEGFGAVLIAVVGGFVVFYELDLFYTTYYFFIKPKTIAKSILNVLSNLTLLIMFFTDSIAHFLFKYVSQIFGEEVILLFALFFIYVILRIVCAVIPVRQSAKRN